MEIVFASIKLPQPGAMPDSRKMLQIVSEGGSGAFFSAAAEKICVVRQPLEERSGALPVSASP